MNSVEIRFILKKLDLCNVYILPIDQLYKVKRDQPFSVVFNSGKSNSTGVHWLALYKSNSGPVQFFDSLGQPIEAYSCELKQFLQVFDEYEVNPFVLQDPTSECCGAYVIYFLQKRHQRESFDSIIETFSGELSLNDQFVLKNIYHCALQL